MGDICVIIKDWLESSILLHYMKASLKAVSLRTQSLRRQSTSTMIFDFQGFKIMRNKKLWFITYDSPQKTTSQTSKQTKLFLLLWQTLPNAHWLF